jgi:hypothetical protein
MLSRLGMKVPCWLFSFSVAMAGEPKIETRRASGSDPHCNSRENAECLASAVNFQGHANYGKFATRERAL